MKLVNLRTKWSHLRKDTFCFQKHGALKFSLARSYVFEERRRFRVFLFGTFCVILEERNINFPKCIKYTNKIICLDSDEYLDGALTKAELEEVLEQNKATVFYCRWVQYASKDTIRMDDIWKYNLTDRIGSYSQRAVYSPAQRHSLHLPPSKNSSAFNHDRLFIAHLQWLDKRWVGVKQYFWKVTDYVANQVHGAKIVGKEAYDNSVNNFQWITGPAPAPLRVRDDIYKIQNMKENDRLKDILRLTRQYNIPNLGDWGMGIYEYCMKD